MRLHLLCVARRPPDWVEAASVEYAKRLQATLPIKVVTIAPHRSGQGHPDRHRAAEAERLSKAIPAGAWRVVLDERGVALTTIELAAQLESWRERHADVALVIGGADGLDVEFVAASNQVWSLSRLTLPHQLVRVIVLEQFYRAWSYLNNHPYHRG